MHGVSEEERHKLKEEVMHKKRQQKLRELRKKKKTLTIFTPFELRTSKRIRIEAEQMGAKAETTYEPLWL